jgi:uncharacterized protein with HEPN domain
MQSIFDKELIESLLENMIDASDKIILRTKDITSSDDFLDNDTNMIILDSVCMQLIAIGEATKELDKLTQKQLLNKYDEIPWEQVAGIRDILSHHYFDLNADIVFDVCQNHIQRLKQTLINIKSDFS